MSPRAEAEEAGKLLVEAAYRGDQAEVERLLAGGANPNAHVQDEYREDRRLTPLFGAVRSLRPDIVEILLKAGAKLEDKDPEGRTALWVAATLDSTSSSADPAEMIRQLLKAGADINHRNAAGQPLVLAALDYYDVKASTIEALLEGKPDLSLRDKDGRNALFDGVWWEKFHPLIDRMIALGADPKISDHKGTNLLMVAARNNSPEMVRKFLDIGLSPMAGDIDGDNAMHHAAMAWRAKAEDPFGKDNEKLAVFDRRIGEIFSILHAAGANPAAADKHKVTPLHLAAEEAGPAAVRWLLPHYPSPDVMDAEGNTPLHRAAASGQLEVLDLLLPEFSDPDPRDIKGWTPLMLAVSADHRDAVLKLQGAGADINARDGDDKSVFAHVLETEDFGQRHLDSARFLLGHGAKAEGLALGEKRLLEMARSFHALPPGRENYAAGVSLFAGLVKDVELLDADGMTALMWVAASNMPSALEALLKRKPDLNARSPDGRNALMWAAAAGATETMKMLEEAGADKTLRDTAGRSAADWLALAKDTGIPRTKVELPVGESTPLLERALRSKREALAEYLKLGAWKADDRIAGSAPLHLAAALGDTAALTVLLDRGALANQELADGSTALMEAAGSGQIAALELLLKRGANAAMRDKSEQRAIDRAVVLRHADAARLLLAQRDWLGSTETRLLMSLVHAGDSGLLEEFLKAGAVVGAATVAADGCCPGRDNIEPVDLLRTAAGTADPAMLRVLLKYPKASGADQPLYLSAALQQAAEEGQLSNVKFLVEEAGVDPELQLEGGDDLFSSGPLRKAEGEAGGTSVLAVALEGRHDEIVRYLVERGVKIRGHTPGGLSPLEVVISRPSPEMLRYLLDRGADWESPDKSGQTLLHYAAKEGNAPSIRVLLEKGAKADAKDSEGRTPLDLARGTKSEEAVRLLEAAGK